MRLFSFMAIMINSPLSQAGIRALVQRYLSSETENSTAEEGLMMDMQHTAQC